MASFLVPCARCSIQIRFMVAPDPEIPQFCGRPECVKARRKAAQVERKDFVEARKAMAEKLSVGQENRKDMRQARGPDPIPAVDED